MRVAGVKELVPHPSVPPEEAYIGAWPGLIPARLDKRGGPGVSS